MENIKESIWADGIPAKIDPKSLLEMKDILKLGIDFMDRYLTQKKYQVLGINDHLDELPNLLAEKDNVKYAIVLVPSTYKKYRTIKNDLRVQFARDCKNARYVPIFCSVAIFSTDSARAEKELYLSGDLYQMTLIGSKKITEDVIQDLSVSTLDFQF